MSVFAMILYEKKSGAEVVRRTFQGSMVVFMRRKYDDLCECWRHLTSLPTQLFVLQLIELDNRARKVVVRLSSELNLAKSGS